MQRIENRDKKTVNFLGALLFGSLNLGLSN